MPTVVIRNLFRHRARTMSALSAIVFGVIALVIASGFIDWIYWAMRESAIESRLGHIQVMKPGYLERGAADPYRYLLPERSPVLDQLKHDPDVEVVTPRLAFSGLISHGDATVSFLGEGVQPDIEARVSLQLHMTAGSGLSSATAKETILGEGLAKSLGVVPGDRVILLANTASGGVNAVELQVRGIFQTTTKAYDDVALRVPIGIARTLARVEGAHLWVVLIDKNEHTKVMLDSLRERYPEASSGVSFVSWYDQADFYNKTVQLFSKQVSVVWTLIAVVIVLSISNTMIMSVLERTRELGTLLALGFRRGAILRQFIGEGLTLGVAGGVVGLVIGVGGGGRINAGGNNNPAAPRQGGGGNR